MTRTFRPQFTLRLLFLVIAMLGVWRWPWREVKNVGPVTKSPVNLHANGITLMRKVTSERVQFHRGWQGKKLMHGHAESFDAAGRLVLRQTWRDGVVHGLETWFNEQGEHILEQTWQDGQLHGPFRFGDGKRWSREGCYVAGKLTLVP